MTDEQKILPVTPEQRQACATTAATRQVYDEIEKLSAVIKETGRPMAERVDAKYALVNASERLCNLMALAEDQLETHTTGDLREQLRGNLLALRERLMGLGGRLMVEKLEKIDKRAETVLHERDYPIGLAGKLDITFGNLMSHLNVLGGPERMGDGVPTLVAKTRSDINNLVQIEELGGVMKDLQPDKPKD
jgi:hypothetical protein